jgi:hypothetical protein
LGARLLERRDRAWTGGEREQRSEGKSRGQRRNLLKDAAKV